MEWLAAWLGDLRSLKYLSEQQVDTILIGVSALCGAIAGLEREKREKPAGLRTLILICVGCAIFTIASLLIADAHTDRGRIASNVIPGIGFLGAGAIIRERGGVVGLTTAATIWAVAGIGIVVGIGYAAAGIALSFFIFLILTFLRVLEQWMFGPCRLVTAEVLFRPERGKTHQRLLAILDAHHIHSSAYRFAVGPAGPPLEGPQGTLTVHYCSSHRTHRLFLTEVAALPEVAAIEETDQKRSSP